MNFTLYRPLGTALGTAMLAATICFHPPLAQAEIVSTDQLNTQHNSDVERGKIQAFLDRSSVSEKLLTMGVDGLIAKERIAALDDQEVHALAEKIDSLPAGGNFSNDQLIIVVLIAILVAILV